MPLGEAMAARDGGGAEPVTPPRAQVEGEIGNAGGDLASIGSSTTPRGVSMSPAASNAYEIGSIRTDPDDDSRPVTIR